MSDPVDLRGGSVQTLGRDWARPPGRGIVASAMRNLARVVGLGTGWLLFWAGISGAPADIPLPEHPRPIFERESWINLNGWWSFRFDPADVGIAEGWHQGGSEFPERIRVPFPWGSPLSGVEDEAEIAWYGRDIELPAAWLGRRVFLVIGASDWHSTVWLDSERLGDHRGGYIPFEIELTERARFGDRQRLVVRVDDRPRPFKLEGKQGYGNARGIWQTVYLEARGDHPLGQIRFIPDPSNDRVEVEAELIEAAPRKLDLELVFRNVSVPTVRHQVPRGTRTATFAVEIPDARRWTLDDPFLYEVEVGVGGTEVVEDRVSTYFGMRSIGVERLPGDGYPYVALNGEPVYLRMALDQAYHPEGFYTFPSDEFVRDEIVRSLKIGLNGMRVHVKTPVPRKLYWADRLGLLIMADVPNSWGEPTPEMREETVKTLEGMIRRDFNHPSVFSWVIFNETWGLRTEGEGYTRETQEWVESMYLRAKALDPTRLVEDNSPNRGDHVVTDINSWHSYLPGYLWRERLAEIVNNTYPGSPWNYVEGRTQGEEPLFNSECGNVWGYEGSTGDVDWSWDYHLMINEFRRQPKICGWLYTEHHDVINEWNGYYRYDRSEKETGLGELVPGMSLRDLHSSVYVVPGEELCADVDPGQEVEVPLFVSVQEFPPVPGEFVLRTRLYGWDDLGVFVEFGETSRSVTLERWSAGYVEPLRVAIPRRRGLLILAFIVEDATGIVFHRNFTTFRVGRKAAPRDETRSLDGAAARLIRFAPGDVTDARWESGFQSEVLGGLKVNGAPAGYFEYAVTLPNDLDLSRVKRAYLMAELSARRVLGRDIRDRPGIEGDFMRGEGTHDPGRNPNAYPMTDEDKSPSLLWIRADGVSLGRFYLPDDPADHRGILSWHAQLRDRRLREAGTYGYLIEAPIPPDVLRNLAREGRRELVLRFEVDSTLPGGLAVYGERFGRYPLDPTLVFIMEGEGAGF
jgi:hypothetical protein